jgi:isopenicillin-N epimerase
MKPRPDLWELDPGVAHLNHGSFGAVPRPVLAARDAAARAVERSPETFYRTRLHEERARVRAVVAGFLGCPADWLSLHANPTEAIAVVLRAVQLGSGDSIVLSDHAYEWVVLAVERWAEAAGACVRTVELPPDAGDASFERETTRRFLDAVDGTTRLVVIDEIASRSAWRLPVRPVLEGLAGEVPLLLDAAHAPGMLAEPVTPGAAFWVGAMHKWAFAPRTVGALVVDPAWHDRVRPLVVSQDADLPYPARFAYQGTRDLSSLLAVPAGLAFPEEHLGIGWGTLRAANRDLLARGCALLAERLRETVGPVRVGPDFGLSMRTVTLPVRVDSARAIAIARALHEVGVEVAAHAVRGRLSLRLSAQAYVAPGDFERLSDALGTRGAFEAVRAGPPREPPGRRVRSS